MTNPRQQIKRQLHTHVLSAISPRHIAFASGIDIDKTPNAPDLGSGASRRGGSSPSMRKVKENPDQVGIFCCRRIINLKML